MFRLCLESVIFNWFLQSWWCFHGSLGKGVDRDSSKKATVLFFTRPQAIIVHTIKRNNMWKPQQWRGNRDLSADPQIVVCPSGHASPHVHPTRMIWGGFNCWWKNCCFSQRVTQIPFIYHHHFTCLPLLTWNIGNCNGQMDVFCVSKRGKPCFFLSFQLFGRAAERPRCCMKIGARQLFWVPAAHWDGTKGWQ